ncbi:alpha/beta fold hydrolase [Jidongwangia harbinensis]|uniref:alpha/beta fold hydrolase n=1 Tax=Jidongwangia harbinensis TaxID=2878561 RepID=UPI001CD9BD39|nr:alpha/beta fold hydrolase [Jidongwangia harbinensis]MCA2211697.1 alpha/beta fold hydrolase [Jidongwangia harbinensis]
MGLTRRGVLGGAAALSTGAAVPGAGDRHPGRPRGVTTIVIVAGANGGAGGDNELTLRGHRTVGVELPGHGLGDGQFRLAYQCPQNLAALATERSPMAGLTLDDYAEAAVATVRRAARNGPVLLWGGSMAGATVNRVANAVPHLIERLVYSSAFCCVDLPSMAAYLMEPEAADSMILELGGAAVGDPAVIGATRSNFRIAEARVLAKLKEALCADATDAEFLALLNTMQPDESTQIPLDDARAHRDTWGRIPRTYIRHTRDRMIPLALQDRFIREADRLTPDNRFDVRSIATTHLPDPRGWASTVDIVDGLARA